MYSFQWNLGIRGSYQGMLPIPVLNSIITMKFTSCVNYNILQYNKACFIHLTPRVVQKLSKTIGDKDSVADPGWWGLKFVSPPQYIPGFATGIIVTIMHKRIPVYCNQNERVAPVGIMISQLCVCVQ